MKKIFFALALLWPSGAWAQCTGIFPANTLCGNLSGSPQPPAAFSAGGTVIGPGSTTSGHIATFGNSVGTLLADPTTITTSQALTLSGFVTVTSQFTSTTSAVFSGLTNHTSQFQINGLRIQFPVIADTVGGLATSQSWTGTNSFTTVNVSGSVSTAALTVAGVTIPITSAPTFQTFLTSTSAGGSSTYTTPTGVKWIHVRLVGGGAGGGGSGGTTTSGSAGVSTSFGTNYLISGGGLGGGAATGAAATTNIIIGGAGGTAQISTANGWSGAGGPGHTGVYFTSNNNNGPGAGGNSCISGGASAFAGISVTLSGNSAAANSGAGGSGGASAGGPSGGGGGAGACVDVIIPTPNVSYAVIVGGGGAGGTGTTSSGAAGGSGGIGIVFVDEHYSN